MSDPLERIAAALERMSPAPLSAPDFAHAGAFVWHVERSYPQGRSDLEFVGKYNEKFAGLRWVIEFKYYSNTKFKKFDTSIEEFELLEADTQQIKGYVEGLTCSKVLQRSSVYGLIIKSFHCILVISGDKDNSTYSDDLLCHLHS